MNSHLLRKIGLGAMAASLFAVVSGCNQGTPGGPGATTPPAGHSTTTNRADLGQSDETFTLSTPTLSTHIKQSETKTESIGVSRGKNFDQDVVLQFTDLPNGVTVTPADATIKHGEKDTKVTFHAADDAALGNFTIKVAGHPATGPDAVTTFKLTVDAK